MIDVINRMLAPLRARLANMVARAVLLRVDDSAKIQVVQIGMLEDEVRSDLERIQQFGLTSVPQANAEAVAIFVGGRRDHGFVVAVDDRRYRPTGLQPGEVALYDASGSLVLLKANGDIELTPKSGVVKVIGDVVAGSISLQNHTHPPGAGESAGPYPVSGNTGKPV